MSDSDNQVNENCGTFDTSSYSYRYLLDGVMFWVVLDARAVRQDILEILRSRGLRLRGRQGGA